MKKNQLASLALLGLASALVSTPVTATENIQENYLVAHGCAKGGCASQKNSNGQIAENTLPSNELQNAAAKPQSISPEEKELLNKQDQEKAQQAQKASHGCAAQQQRAYQGNNQPSHSCAGAKGAAHSCGSR